MESSVIMPSGGKPFPFGDCRICYDKATGVHYGVATCEGCKGFFKRSIPKADKYKCFFGGQCVLSPQNRNRCKACRFRNCLAMGMSVDAVKMGRIPKIDKERALEAFRREHEVMSPTSTQPHQPLLLSNLPHQQQKQPSPLFSFSPLHTYPTLSASTSASSFSFSSSNSDIKVCKGKDSTDSGLSDCTDGDVNGGTFSVDGSDLVNINHPSSRLDVRDDVLMSDPRSNHAMGLTFDNRCNPMTPDSSNQYQQAQSRFVVGQDPSKLFGGHIGGGNLTSLSSPVETHQAGNKGECIPGTPSNPQQMTSPACGGFNQSNSMSTGSPLSNKPAFSPTVIKEIIEHVIESGQGQELQNTLVSQFLGMYAKNPSRSSDSVVSDGLSESSFNVSQPFPRYSGQELMASSSSLASSTYTLDDPSSYLGSTEKDPGSLRNMNPTMTSMRQLGINSFYPDHHRSFETLHTNPSSVPKRKSSCPVYSFNGKSSHMHGMDNLQEYVDIADCKNVGVFSAPNCPDVRPDYHNKTKPPLPSAPLTPSMSHNSHQNIPAPAQKPVNPNQQHRSSSVLNYFESMDLNDLDVYLAPGNTNKVMSGEEEGWGKMVTHSGYLVSPVVKALTGGEAVYYEQCGIDSIIGCMDEISPLFGYLKNAGLSFVEQVEQYQRIMEAENVGDIAVHPLNQLEKASKHHVMYVWDQLMESIPQCNILVLGLCRDIPKFSDLDPKDQAILMEEAYFDIWLTMNAPLFHNGDSYLRLPCKARYSRWWMLYFLPQTLVQRMFTYTQQINDCRLDHTQMVTICAIQLTNPDRVGVVNQALVANLHKLYIRVLAALVRQTHPSNYIDVLVRIFNTLPMLGCLSKEQADVIGHFKIDSPPEGVLKYAEDNCAVTPDVIIPPVDISHMTHSS